MKRFKKAYIEITNNCNLNCSFCPKTTREKKFMNVSEYEHILKEIKPYVNFIYLHLMGEPLMHPNLKDILEVSNKYGMKINITTNGTLIEKNKQILLDENLGKSIRKVSFSIHSFESNNRKQMLDYNLKKYLKDILVFSNDYSNLGKTIVLKLWNIDSTNIEVNDKKGKNELNDLIFKYIYAYLKNDMLDVFVDAENMQSIESITKMNDDFEFKNFKEELLITGNLKIKEHVYIQLGEKFEWPIQTSEEHEFEKIFCYGTMDQFGILAGGDVVPCCLDSEGLISFGNAFEQSFENIIKSDKFKNFNNKISSGICPCDLCKKCTYARRRVNNEFK